MRPLEFVIPLLLAIYLLLPPPRPFIIRTLPTGALLLTLIHFVIEGFRWQMLPIYALSLIMTATTFFSADIKPIASYLTFFLLAI